jgi:hypothetical protein
MDACSLKMPEDRIGDPVYKVQPGAFKRGLIIASKKARFRVQKTEFALPFMVRSNLYINQSIFDQSLPGL